MTDSENRKTNAVNGWNNETFSFTSNFQLEIIAAMVQQPKVFEKIGLLVDNRYFEIKDYSIIFRAIQNFYDYYKGLPTKESLYEKIQSDFNKSNISDKVKDNELESIKNTIESIFNYKKLNNASISFIEEEVKNFIACQVLKKAIEESIDDLGSPDKHNNVRERIEKALIVGASLDDYGIEVYDKDEILKRWQRRKEGVEIERLPSLWSRFDNIFGGFGAGEVFTFMGAAHSGKSMYLINVGANAALQKKNVLHFTLEMSEEITTQRYDMRLLGLTKDKLCSPESIQKLKQLKEKHLGRIIVKRFPSGEVSTTDLATYIKRVEGTKDFVPDILIVDYADILKPNGTGYKEKRFELEKIYMQLRNLAIDLNLPIVTGTQLNRGALDKIASGVTVTEEDIAEAYAIQRHIDAGVTINATPVDTKNHKHFLYVTKNRDGEHGDKIDMYVDFSMALVRDWAAI